MNFIDQRIGYILLMNKIIVFLIFLAASLIEVNAIEIITALKIYRDSPFNLSSDEKVKYEKLAIGGDGDAAYKLGRYYLYCENTEYNEKNSSSILLYITVFYAFKWIFRIRQNSFL